MAVKVPVQLDAPDDALTGLGAGAVIRLQSAATETGVFANLTTIAVVAATFYYEYWDFAGDTTTWYRWRLENAAGTETGEWTDPLQGVDPAVGDELGRGFADLDDLLLTMRQAVTDSKFLGAAQRELLNASRELTQLVGYGVSREPSTVRYFDGTGDGRLHVHSGMVSVSLVEMQLTQGGAWTALQAENTGWVLEGEPDDLEVLTGEPYFHIALIPGATYQTFVKGRRNVRVTHVPGWPAIPTTWRTATVALARQSLAGQNLLPGGQLGPDEFGSPSVGKPHPQVVYDLLVAERHRHWCHL